MFLDNVLFPFTASWWTELFFFIGRSMSTVHLFLIFLVRIVVLLFDLFHVFLLYLVDRALFWELVHLLHACFLFMLSSQACNGPLNSSRVRLPSPLTTQRPQRCARTLDPKNKGSSRTWAVFWLKNSKCNNETWLKFKIKGIVWPFGTVHYSFGDVHVKYR